jgi:hypothetical protein
MYIVLLLPLIALLKSSKLNNSIFLTAILFVVLMPILSTVDLINPFATKE